MSYSKSPDSAVLELLRNPSENFQAGVSDASGAPPSRLKAGLACLAIDGIGLALSAAIAALFNFLYSFSALTAADLEASNPILQVIAIITLTSVFSWFLLRDGFATLTGRLSTPLEYPARLTRRLYWSRLQVWLWVVAFNILLLSIRLIVPQTPLVSQVFLATVFSLMVLALCKSIPSSKLAFGLSVASLIVIILGVQVAEFVAYKANPEPAPSGPNVKDFNGFGEDNPRKKRKKKSQSHLSAPMAYDYLRYFR